MIKKVNTIKVIFSKASSNRKLYVFIFCLFLSSFFWLLNALSKKFITEIDFKVTYINTPKSKVVLNDLSDKINIKIKGLGFDLLAYKLKFTKPLLTIDLAKVRGLNNAHKSIQNITLPTSSFTSIIANQLGDQIEIKNIYPDSILFQVDDKKEKKVKIIPITNITFEKQ